MGLSPIKIGSSVPTNLNSQPYGNPATLNIDSEQDPLDLTATISNLMSHPRSRLNKELAPFHKSFWGCLCTLSSCLVRLSRSITQERSHLQVGQYQQPKSRRLPGRTVVTLPCTAPFKHSLNLVWKHILVSLTHFDTKLERAIRAANLSSVSFHVWVIIPYSLEGDEC